MENLETILNNQDYNYNPGFLANLSSKVLSLFPPKQKLKEQYGKNHLLYYVRESLNCTVGFVTKAAIGVLPAGILEEACSNLKEKYHIEENPLKYGKYSIYGLALSNSINTIAYLGLANVPEISFFPISDDIGRFLASLAMARISYSLIETSIRAYLIFKKKKPFGVFAYELAYYLANKVKESEEKVIK